MTISISEQDRVLVLSLRDTSVLRGLAKAYALVGVGSADEVRAARREFADLPNVMFVQGDRNDIPWQDRWFTLILVPDDAEPTPAMARVLADGGRLALLP